MHRGKKRGTNNSTHKSIDSMIDLSIEIATLGFRIFDSSINQTSIASLSSHSQDQRGIGSRILHRKKKLSTLVNTVHNTSLLGVCKHLWLKHGQRWGGQRGHEHNHQLTFEIARVRDNGGTGLLQLVERSDHDGSSRSRINEKYGRESDIISDDE